MKSTFTFEFSLPCQYVCRVVQSGNSIIFAETLIILVEFSLLIEAFSVIIATQQYHNVRIEGYKLAFLFPCESLEYTQDAPSEENDKEKSTTHSLPLISP